MGLLLYGILIHVVHSFDCTNSSATIQLITYLEGETLEFSFESHHTLLNILLSRVSEGKITHILSVNSDEKPHFYENDLSKTYQTRANVTITEEGKFITVQIPKVKISDAGIYSLLVQDVHNRDPLCYKVDVQAGDSNKTGRSEQQDINRDNVTHPTSGWMVVAIISTVANIGLVFGVVILYRKQTSRNRSRGAANIQRSQI